LKIKLTIEEVIELLRIIGFKLISKEYLGVNKVIIICDEFGYFYSSNLSGIVKGSLPKNVHKKNPYTIQNIKLWCKLNNKSFELVSDTYNGNSKLLKWKCLKEECGEEFESNWSHINNGGNCSVCAGRQVGISNCLATKNPVLASEWHPVKNGDLTPYDVTYGSHQFVWWKCKHNAKHEWNVNIGSRTSSGSGCPYCAHNLPSEDYNLLVINPELCEEWNYDKNDKKPEEYMPNSRDKVWWKCKECNYEWKSVTISDRNNGSGCPECNKSKGEKRCKEVFINNKFFEIDQENYDKLLDVYKYKNKYFIPQKEFEGLVGLGGGLLSYDFYIPKYNLLLEYQGEQHEKYIPGFHKSIEDFEKQVEHDRRKKEHAFKKGYNFLEIWYKDFNSIEEILEKYFK